MKDYKNDINNYILQEIEVLKSLSVDDINIVMNSLEEARINGNKIFICGNGGSASTASHFVCDFNKGVSLNQEKKYNFECLNDNIATMMAIANDIGYESVFEIPLKNKMTTGDVVIGISGSGNSQNVVNALKYANENGGKTIAIVGYSGGKLKEIASESIHVNINNMQIVEDVHMMLDHVMMYILSR